MGNIHIEDPEEQNPPSEPEKKSKAKSPPKEKLGWKEWLETESVVRRLHLAFGFIAIVLLMVLLQFSTRAICCGDWDGYYHIRWSSILWDNLRHFKGLPQFTWLPLTVLNPSDYADHHFLFHLLQIPFLWFFGPVMAAKVAAVFYGSFAIFSVYWLMYRYKVGHLLVWLAALVTCANPFWYRMNMAKAPPLTIIYSVAGIYLLFERRYIWLLPLMFVFVWTYSLFPLLFIAAVIWVAILAWNERIFEWRPLAYTLLGMILGNVVNPYFPNNLFLFWEHFYTKFRSQYEVAVGGEWYSYTGWQLLTHLAVALIAMLVGYLLYKTRKDILPERSTFFLVFATLLMIWMFKSKRLAEYFPPFAILFAAFSWQAFRKPDVIELPEEFQRDLEPLLDTGKGPAPKTTLEILQAALPWVVGVVLTLVLLVNFFGSSIPNEFFHKQEDLRASIRNNEPNDKYLEAMEWAKKHIPPGDRIFNANWDDFPKLFFFNQQNSYVWGLDPNYLYSENPEMYKMVKDITDGKVDDPGPYIREKLGSRWVFSDAKQNEDFLAKLLESGWAETAYEDGEAYILRIRDTKGVPAVPDAGTPSASGEVPEVEPAQDEPKESASPDATPAPGEQSPEPDDDNSAEEPAEQGTPEG